MALNIQPAGAGPTDNSHATASKEAVQLRGKVVVVLIDRIGIDDLSENNLPNIKKLMASGSISLMNARVKYDPYGQGSYVVIGAGGRALGGVNVGLAFNRGELLKTTSGERIRAGDIYSSRTGISAPTGSVCNLYIEEMKKKSDTNLANSRPGLLGQVLREAGKKVTLLGNADSLAPAAETESISEAEPVELEDTELSNPVNVYPVASILHREASCIAMDENGIVPGGDVSSRLSGRYSANTGVATNYDRLMVEAGARLPRSDLLVIDMGQTSRVDEQSDFNSDESLQRARAAALLECDRALGKILDRLDLSRDLVVICTPTPTREMITDGELLTPLIIAGPGYSGGRLSSPTTRRTGLVSNFDIAPTVIKFFGLEIPDEMDGRALSSSSPHGNLSKLQQFRDRTISAYNTRKTMVRVYIIPVIIILLVFLLFLLIREDLVWAHGATWSLLLLIALAGPVAYLIIPAFGARTLSTLIPSAVGVSLFLSLVAIALQSRRFGRVNHARLPVLNSLFFLSGTTLFVILLDLLFKSPLMTLSAFGSDVVMADRYYGIGNLYSGIAIGAAVLLSCLAIELFPVTLDKAWKRYMTAGVILLATIVFLGYPMLGADVGGLVTAVVAALVTLMKLEGGRIGIKKLSMVILAIIVCVAVLLVADMLLPGPASHAGRAVSRIHDKGFAALFGLIGRKMAANWTLTFASTWRLLLALSIITALLLNWRFGLFRYVKKELPRLYAGFIGMAAGLIVALLFNDSGIEAASAISVFLFLPFFIILIGWKKPAISKVSEGS